MAVVRSAPYVSPIDLTSTLPLGVSWTTIGKQASTQPSQDQNTAALDQLCRFATAQVRGEIQQDAHCGMITERAVGPGQWLGTIANGQGRMLCRMFPIWMVVAAAVAPAANFPKSYTVIPPGNAYPELGTMNGVLPSGIGGWSNAILISPSYFGWGFGRYGMEVQMTYLHGWPNAQLTAPVAENATTLSVDSLAGFVASAEANIQDGMALEQVTVVSVTPDPAPAYNAAVTYAPGQTVLFTDGNTYQCLIPSGPNAPNQVQSPGPSSAYWTTTIHPLGSGTITIAEPTANSHDLGTLVTSLPYDIRWATALFAKAMALQRGLATVSLPGQTGHAVSSDEAIVAANHDAVTLLAPYRRIT